jgi:hypothetical protein
MLVLEYSTWEKASGLVKANIRLNAARIFFMAGNFFGHQRMNNRENWNVSSGRAITFSLCDRGFTNQDIIDGEILF